MSMEDEIRVAIQPLLTPDRDSDLKAFLEREDLTPEQMEAFREALDQHSTHLDQIGEHVLDTLDGNHGEWNDKSPMPAQKTE